ncbi:ADP-ribosylation factor [Trichodelitschia bisporula]|uniref:Abnormal eversion of vulva protein 20 n=1 Tax=Trichodelitschia bisporula TaxID=703511 RepID=A0A6G1HJV5_9PEZI|nr:ADP-ribosylation factor [Trichodelitschia bisporula]
MLSILRKARLKDKEMRVLLLGLDAAGKTTICKKLLGEPTDSVSPTLGFIIKTIEHGGFRLNVWDVGGQKTLRTYWKNYFEKTDTLVWVVDGTDGARLPDCRDELHRLLQEERLTGASLLVFKNKSDVPGCLSEDAVREALELDSIRSHRWTIISCSAVTGMNLDAGLEWVVQDAKERLFLF